MNCSTKCHFGLMMFWHRIKERKPTITKRTGFDFKVDTTHCNMSAFCFMNSLRMYNIQKSDQLQICILLFEELFCLSEKNNEEETQRPCFNSERSRSTGSSHHVAKRILHLQTNNDMKARNPPDPEALHLKLRRFRSKG